MYKQLYLPADIRRCSVNGYIEDIASIHNHLHRAPLPRFVNGEKAAVANNIL